jgi:hypothetical protein
VIGTPSVRTDKSGMPLRVPPLEGEGQRLPREGRDNFSDALALPRRKRLGRGQHIVVNHYRGSQGYIQLASIITHYTSLGENSIVNYTALQRSAGMGSLGELYKVLG